MFYIMRKIFNYIDIFNRILSLDFLPKIVGYFFDIILLFLIVYYFDTFKEILLMSLLLILLWNKTR